MRRLTQTESSIAKFVLITVAVLLISSLAAAEYVSYHHRQSMAQQARSLPPPPPPGTTELAITKEGVSLVMPPNSEWRTVAQILALLLGLYGGVRVINRFTDPSQTG